MHDLRIEALRQNVNYLMRALENERDARRVALTRERNARLTERADLNARIDHLTRRLKTYEYLVPEMYKNYDQGPRVSFAEDHSGRTSPFADSGVTSPRGTYQGFMGTASAAGSSSMGGGPLGGQAGPSSLGRGYGAVGSAMGVGSVGAGQGGTVSGGRAGRGRAVQYGKGFEPDGDG
eukprot:TRINITY_DN18128_c0_g1_i2.p2 TRINITY_DN18128_c0_g1~~TRINITY_DN18128_c0_g1_i2.p2  ORF type:complete len:178 (+),score=29.95 TRINITY_DN18128_c0_g1_i2:352-885(+)